MFTLKIFPAFQRWPLLLLLCVSTAPLQAEKADRSKSMTLESDQPCTVNLQKQTSVCSGNVVISQGTLLIRADRLELRETPEGYQLAQASGTAAKPATYRQKRDSVNETVEGLAQRIDYDSRAGTLRFDGAAQVRRLQGAVVADEISGGVIVWDSVAETFNVRGGAVSAANPSGRVRAVIAPRAQADAASSAANAAASPAVSPTANPASSPATSLRTSPTLGNRQ